MLVATCLAILAAIALLGFLLGRRRAWSVGGGSRVELHSLPSYHGLWVALCVLLPAAGYGHLVLAATAPVTDWWVLRSLAEAGGEIGNPSLALSRVESIADARGFFSDGDPAVARAAARLLWARQVADWMLGIGAIACGLAGGLYALPRVHLEFRARNACERVILALLLVSAAVAIATTIGIVLSLVSEAFRFWSLVPAADFFLGTSWSPQAAIRSDQVGTEGAFGVVPVFSGTLLITAIALAVAMPIGLLSATYMVEFATPRLRATAKPVIEMLAGIPTVVYGFFAAIIVAPWMRDLGTAAGLNVSSESALAAGSVMGIMIIPFISSLSDDVISTVPQRLRDGAYGLGATRGETIVRVVLPAALPGLLSATVLAVSRALGETMIVVMAAGLFANLTANPLESVTTVTVQITTVLTGDQPFDSPTTLSAYALGLTLFVVTLALNLFATRVMERYRERYD